MVLPLNRDAPPASTAGAPRVLLGTSANEVEPVFSPDGRWIAYVSDESASSGDVYVQPFPGPGGKWRISAGNAAFPRWSTKAPELLYADFGQRRIMVVRYSVVDGSFRAERPQPWAPTTYSALRGEAFYDLHPDGKRLAIWASPTGEGRNDKLVFFFNFFDYLRQVAPAGRGTRP